MRSSTILIHRIKAYIVVSYITVSVILSGCSEKHNADDTLIIGASGSLVLGSANPVMINRNSNVWETLTTLDHSLVPRPCLAKSWDVSDDGRNWTFILRNDVVFHDGSILDADLVKDNADRLHEHPELDYYSVFITLETASAIDDTTIVLSFSQPVIDLPNKLGHYFAGIFSPSSWQPDGKLNEPTGSGPYIFSDAEIGSYERMTVFADYRNGPAHFITVEYRTIPDPVVRIMSLIRGDIDMIAHHGGVPATHLQLLRGKPGITIDSLDVAITHYLLFNCAREPFNDTMARDAFDRLLNREEMVSLILAGAGTAAHDFFCSKAVRWDNKRFDIQPTLTDIPSTVRNNLTDRPLKLLVNQRDMSSWGYRRVADYLIDIFSRHGVTIEIEVLEGGAWQDATREGQFDITLYPLSMPTGTPELFIRRLAFSGGMRVRSIGNTTHFSSSTVDSLFQKALTSTTFEENHTAYTAILDLLAHDKPILPMYHDRYYFAYRSDLTNVHLDPFLKPDLHAIGETAK